MHRFTARIWRHGGDASWWFVALPQDVSDEIRELTAGRRAGFGSVRVTVTIGRTTWRTSVFPDSARGTYLLPVKKDVRVREQLDDGDDLEVSLEPVDG